MMKKIKITLSAVLAALTIMGVSPVNAEVVTDPKKKCSSTSASTVGGMAAVVGVTAAVALTVGIAYAIPCINERVNSPTVGKAGGSLTRDDFKKYIKCRPHARYGSLRLSDASLAELIDVKIRSGVKSIEKDAFRDCCIPRNIFIPDSVEHIDPCAFSFDNNIVHYYGLKITYRGREYSCLESFFEAFNKDHPQNVGTVAQ